ncbi:hypothetical protein ALC53_08928 [Atta colombica]|uniref:Uncharacterized protein n=1 Tax=Atta colombica TaxID=520822 RepID=A0A151I1S4_9HYME|nr:hypothetical protein ALC53_08928 [Atta colombica]
MPGDVTLESTMAAAPCGSWRYLAASFLGRPETVRRFVCIAHGRCSWSQSGEVEGGKTVSVATVATVRARTTSLQSRERVGRCRHSCRAVHEVSGSREISAVSCLRASTGLVIAERPNAPQSRGESEVRRRDGTASEGGPNSCTVSCVCASCVGRHSVVRCPRARRDSRRENNGVDLGSRSGNERERESVSEREEEKERTVTTREEEREREREKEKETVSFSNILFFKLSNLMKKLIQFSSALKIRRSFIQDFERGNCATISQHREEISRVRFNISPLRLLKRLQLCPKTT